MKKSSTLLACLFIILVLVMASATFADSKKPRRVTFNFVDVELLTVTKFVSELTGRNFILDERVKGKVTIIAPTPLSIDDAFNLFTSVLALKGFAVVRSGVNAHKIIPLVEARQHGLTVTTGKTILDDSYLARLIQLNNITSDEAIKFLRPIISRHGHIAEFGPGNMILVVDKGLIIERLLSLVEQIDKSHAADKPELVMLRFSNAETVAKLLNDTFGKKLPTPPGHAPRLGALAAADPRLNAVILMGDEKVRESMKAVISLTDIRSPDTGGKINVYYLENADATELAMVLEGLLKAQQTAVRPAAPGAIAAAVAPFEAAGGISIIPDKATNSLVIIASPVDYQNIFQVIRQLDKRRKQVFVESMIVEASMDKLRELGTKWRAIAKSGGEPIAVGGFGTIDNNAINAIISGLTGLTVGGLGNFFNVPGTNLTVPGFAALFNLNEFRDAVNVLSTPHILTSDNKEAEIIVGENVPIISRREADPARPGSVFSTIERKDVGITLRITPQITEGDNVRLDIYKEISSVKAEPAEIVTTMGPTTTKRSTKTSVVVRDGQTVVIGGLMQERAEEIVTRVPFLGDIPILGWLFKYRTMSTKKTNLLVFLTPHVIKDEDRMGVITKDREADFAKMARQYADGELLIRFKDGVSRERALSIIKERRATVIDFNENIKVYRLRLRKNLDVEDAVKEFSALPEVELAEPNYIIRRP